MHTSETVISSSSSARKIAWTFFFVVMVALAIGIGKRILLEKHKGAVQGRLVTERSAEMNAPPRVEVTLPRAFEHELVVPMTGMLDPVIQADLGFDVGGRIASINVTLGQEVTKGQILSSLDGRSVSAQSAIASSAVQAAETQLAMAEDRLTRAQNLHASNSISEAEYTAARQQRDLAQAQLSQAHAQGRVYSAARASHVLRAPFSGMITRVPTGVGNVVAPGQAIFRIEDLSSLILRGGLTERDIARVRVGDKVILETQPPMEGTITALASSLDPISRRAPVEISVVNDQHQLVGHVLAKAQISTNRRVPAHRIPATALQSDQTVLTVNSDNQIEIRSVQATVDSDGTAIIFSGLQPNEHVVIRPSADLRAGRVVQPNVVTQ